MTASRMRACACDTASRLCVRTELCRDPHSPWPRPFAPRAPQQPRPPCSLASALLTGRVRLLHRAHCRLRPPAFPATSRPRRTGTAMKISRFLRAKGFCACQGLRRRGASMCLAISTPAVLPSVGRKTSAPRTCLTPLNTSPALLPCERFTAPPSRAARASLRAGAVRYAFTVTDFHRLPLAGLPRAHPSRHDRATRRSQQLHSPLDHGAVAVGTAIAGRPPHRSRRALLTHRAPTLDGDEEPLLWPRMQDARDWQVPVGDRLHSGPRQSMSLAAAHQRAMPGVRSCDAPECRDRGAAHRHSIVGHPSPQDLGKPFALPIDPHRGGVALSCSLISRSLVRMRLAIGFLPSTKPVPVPPGSRNNA